MLVALLLYGTATAQAATKRSKANFKRVLIGIKGVAGSEIARRVERWVRDLGGIVDYIFRIVPAMAARLPETLIKRIRENVDVLYVEDDSPVRMTEQRIPWGIKRVGADGIWPTGNKGGGVKIALLDTGIDYTHPDLDANYKGGYDFVNDDADPMDDNRHGTYCAGIIAAEDNDIGVVGVAPEASLYAVKVLDGNGVGRWSTVVAGIEWAMENGMDVVSMSLAGPYSTTMEQACAKAYEAGLLLVAAAGNEYGGEVLYPAKWETVIAVSAVDDADQIANFSSVGPEVELAAPGVYIYTTSLHEGYTYVSGTSAACPHVSGIAALIIAAGVRGNTAVRARLDSTADDLGDPGRDKFYGFGLVNAKAASPPTVNQPPIANAGGPYAGTIGEAITFDASGSIDDGTIVSYEWDWDNDGVYDDRTSSPKITHAWSEAHTGTITLRVTDDEGLTDTDTTSVTVTPGLEILELCNVPNPFRQNTVFCYYLTREADVTIEIYSVSGRLIKAIEIPSARALFNEQPWDGRDDLLREVANGVYIYRVVATDGGQTAIAVGKLAVLR
jgi:subtilisin family serine protease